MKHKVGRDFEEAGATPCMLLPGLNKSLLPYMRGLRELDGILKRCNGIAYVAKEKIQALEGLSRWGAHVAEQEAGIPLVDGRL